MRTSLAILVANFGLLLPCCHSWGDEPESLADTLPPRSRLDLSRTGDDSVRRVQASATPSPGAGQPGTATPRPAPSPAQAAPSSTTPTPPRPNPSPEAVPAAPTTTPALPSTADTTLSQPGFAAATAAAAAAAGMETAGGFGELSSFGQGGTFQMIGDQAPLTLRQAASPAPGLPTPFPPGTPPPPPSPRQASAIVPSVRGFKIAENQSPQPQDRVFFTFDYFSDLNGALNRRFEAPFDEPDSLIATSWVLRRRSTSGGGSFGHRLPLDQLTATSTISGNFAKPGGTSTSLNDLSLFTKYVLKADPATGSLLSVGSK